MVGAPFLIFWGNSTLFSTVTVLVCILTNSWLGFPFLHILTNTCLILSFSKIVLSSMYLVSSWEFFYQLSQPFLFQRSFCYWQSRYFICSLTVEGFLGTWRNILRPYQNSLLVYSTALYLCLFHPKSLSIPTLWSHLATAPKLASFPLIIPISLSLPVRHQIALEK